MKKEKRPINYERNGKGKRIPHSESRNQRILDFANPEVVEYMTKLMENVFSAGNSANL